MIHAILVFMVVIAAATAQAFSDGPVKFNNTFALMYTDDAAYTSRLLHMPHYQYSILSIKGDNKLDFDKNFELRRYFLKPRALVRLTPEFPLEFCAVGQVEAFWHKFDVTIRKSTVTKQADWLEGRAGVATVLKHHDSNFSIHMELDAFLYETRSNGSVETYVTLKYKDVWVNNLLHIHFDARKSYFEQVTVGYTIAKNMSVFWQGQSITDKALVNRLGLAVTF